MKIQTNNVLLTGAGGFLAGFVEKRFKRAEWNIITTVRKRKRSPADLVLDFSHSDALSVLAEIPACKTIVHTASHVDFSEGASVQDFFSTNAFAVSVLSNLCRKWDARLIFVSGTIVFGCQELVDHESLPNPNLPYGQAKLLAESILETAGVETTILRPAGIFGYRGPEHLGINRAITAAVDKREVPRYAGEGKAKRNYIFVEDLAETIFHCANQQIKGTHIVAGIEVVSIREMLDSISEILLPGHTSQKAPGTDGVDVIAEHSTLLPKGRSFKQALESIRVRVNRLAYR